MKRREFVKIAAMAPAFAAVVDTASPTASVAPIYDAQAGFTFYSPVAEAWYRSGQFFDWTSTTKNNSGRTVKIFYHTFGDRSHPAVVALHGYPNSSFDYRELIPLLEKDYFVCVLDFPGFGFSDKPQDGYSYMLEDAARLVDYWIRDVLHLSRFHLYTHDRGVSVGLAFLEHFLAEDSRRRSYDITYHFVSNSGMFLPLASLSQGQTDLLDPVRGPAAIARLRATPRATQGTPVQVAEADILAFNDGIGARLHVGKYQLERAANEARWLANLRKSPVPTTLLWGMRDTVNPLRIANYVWQTCLNDRTEESSYWLLPNAGHYPQVDQPADVARIVRLCLEGRIPKLDAENAFMGELARDRTPIAATYAGRSRIKPVRFPGAVVYSPAGYRY